MHRLQKVIRRAFLAQEAMRARPQHVDRVLALRKAGQDQYPRVGIARPHVTEDVHAAAVRHPDVEDQELPGALPQPFQGLLASCGLADFAHRVVLGEHLPKPGADYRVVVRDQYPGGHHGSYILLKVNPFFSHPSSLGAAGYAYDVCRTMPTWAATSPPLKAGLPLD